MSRSFRLASTILGAALGLTFAGCSAASGPTEEPKASAEPVASTSAGPVDGPPAAERRKISVEDCDAKGGKIVGDIGDGAVHRPEYRCPSGSPPIGRVEQGIEGAVCCQ